MIWTRVPKLVCNVVLQDSEYKYKRGKKHHSRLCQVFHWESVLYRTINLKGSSPCGKKTEEKPRKEMFCRRTAFKLIKSH